eukprot:7388109-Prymnesium_polylepis.2
MGRLARPRLVGEAAIPAERDPDRSDAAFAIDAAKRDTKWRDDRFVQRRYRENACARHWTGSIQDSGIASCVDAACRHQICCDGARGDQGTVCGALHELNREVFRAAKTHNTEGAVNPQTCQERIGRWTNSNKGWAYCNSTDGAMSRNTPPWCMASLRSSHGSRTTAQLYSKRAAPSIGSDAGVRPMPSELFWYKKLEARREANRSVNHTYPGLSASRMSRSGCAVPELIRPARLCASTVTFRRVPLESSGSCVVVATRLDVMVETRMPWSPRMVQLKNAIPDSASANPRITSRSDSPSTARCDPLVGPAGRRRRVDNESCRLGCRRHARPASRAHTADISLAIEEHGSY